MPVEISLQLQDTRWKAKLAPYTKTVRVACEAALAALKVKKGEVAIVLADDAFIKELNRDFRGKNKPTNVLSFPNEDEPLGDIIVAFETIEREAKEQGKSFRDHTTHLLVHGVLHLLGHDHMSDKEAAAMEAKEVKILGLLGVSNPYL